MIHLSSSTLKPCYCFVVFFARLDRIESGRSACACPQGSYLNITTTDPSLHATTHHNKCWYLNGINLLTLLVMLLWLGQHKKLITVTLPSSPYRHRHINHAALWLPTNPKSSTCTHWHNLSHIPHHLAMLFRPCSVLFRSYGFFSFFIISLLLEGPVRSWLASRRFSDQPHVEDTTRHCVSFISHYLVSNAYDLERQFIADIES